MRRDARRRALGCCLPFGARGLKDALAPWAAPSGGLRATRGADAIVGWYLGAAPSIALGYVAAGIMVVDDASLRVDVYTGGPAARAGIKKGDRIVAVQGEAVKDWDQLKRIVGRRGGEVTLVTIARGGTESVVEAVPFEHEGRGRLMMGPYTETRPASLGGALAVGLVEPFKIVVAIAKDVTRSEQFQFAGPVAIVKEASVLPGFATGARFGGSLGAYVLPLVVLLSFALAFVRPGRAQQHPFQPRPRGDARRSD